MESIGTYLLTQGILGVVAFVEAIVIIRLYSKTEKMETRMSELQEARRLDAVETRTDVTSILPGISQSLQNISDKIEISKESGRGK